jgi:hypothetical protein
VYDRFPAIGISGLGIVKVEGRRREPRPAIGTIIFIVPNPKGGTILGVSIINYYILY